MNWGDSRLSDRFWSKVVPEPNSGCWLWVGSIKNNGYAQVTFKCEVEYAHRLAYSALVGKIEDSLQIDHLCKVKCCVNPIHLEVVSQQENLRRAAAWTYQTEKLYCPRGHAYEGKNLYTNPNRPGRACRACHATKSLARYYKRKYEQNLVTQ